MAEGAVSMNDVEIKFEEYAKFVRDILRPDYEICRQAEQEIRMEIQDYTDLTIRISNDLKNKGTETKILMDVDLGYGKVTCRAEVIGTNARLPNQGTIYLHVGMGFHVEYTWDEASVYIQKRIKYLNDIALPHRISKTKKVLSHLQSSERILDELSHELQRMKH
jgi:prefoldin subunit 5